MKGGDSVDLVKVKKTHRQYKQVLMGFAIMFLGNIAAHMAAPIEFNLLSTIILCVMCASGFAAFLHDYKRWKQSFIW